MLLDDVVLMCFAGCHLLLLVLVLTSNDIVRACFSDESSGRLGHADVLLPIRT